MKSKLRYLWYIPVGILGPVGFIIGAIGVGMILFVDMCVDKAKGGKDETEHR